jgi:hypothetical protein
MNKCLYLIGSLRNERIPELANKIRKDNPDVEVFDEWYSAGPRADDHWKDHQRSKGLSYQEALRGYAAKNVFNFDRRHLDRSTHALLVLPAGKSGHMEIMYAAYGVGAKTGILLEEEDVRWDVMYQFIPTILNSDKEIKRWLNSPEEKTTARNPKMELLPTASLSGQLLRSSPSEQKSMTHTTGGEALCTPSYWGCLSSSHRV